MSAVRERYGVEDEAMCHRLLSWCREHGDAVRWGKGRKDGSMRFVVQEGGAEHVPFTVATWSGGTVDINFGYLKKRLPFADESLRRELLERLNLIPAVQLAVEQLGGYLSVPLRTLRSAEAQQQLLSVFRWVVTVIRNGVSA